MLIDTRIDVIPQPSARIDSPSELLSRIGLTHHTGTHLPDYGRFESEGRCAAAVAARLASCPDCSSYASVSLTPRTLTDISRYPPSSKRIHEAKEEASEQADCGGRYAALGDRREPQALHVGTQVKNRFKDHHGQRRRG